MEEVKKENQDFKDYIHIIRGQQVMLDSDLAKLYGTEISKLNQQVKRNINKFPDDFMFQLEKEEIPDSLKSHFVTLNKKDNKRGQHIKKMPYAFTEQGIYMIATILKNDIATQQSIYIMRSFKEMRHYLAEHKSLLDNTNLLELSTTVIRNKDDIQNIKNTMATKSDIDKLMDNFLEVDNIKEKLFLDGQVFDAMEAYINIYQQAKNCIYIIDAYISLETLRLLKHKKKNVQVIIITSNKAKHKLTKAEVTAFNIQYPSLSLRYTDNIHDRFLIIDYNTDKEKIYVCGASSKDAGKKICTITRLYNSEMIHTMMDELLKCEELLL